MEKITIIIPTRNRLGKLLRLLATISRYDWIKVIVAVDGDYQTIGALTHPLGAPALMSHQEQAKVRDFYNPDLIMFSRWHIGSMAICNLMSPLVEDGLIQACDDMEFQTGTLEKALESFNRHFPDDDGVLGFHQEGIPSYGPTGIFLMGQTFLRRYPRKQVFFPGYKHYGDGEVFRLADHLGRFAFERGAAVYHHHPGVHKNQADQTHQESQMCKDFDKALSLERQYKGKIWGKPEEEEGWQDKALNEPPRDRMIKQEQVEIR